MVSHKKERGLKMRKYLSCVILIILCIVCAMIFYVNANEFVPNDDGSSDTINNSDSVQDADKDTTDAIQIATIEKEGTIVSEHLTDTNLRIEYAMYKLDGEDNLYLSCEMYIDTKTPITKEASGYLSVNGVKKEFSLTKTLGTSTLLASITSSLEFNEGEKINIEGALDIDIDDSNGVILDCLIANGTIIASEGYSKMPNSYLINMEHISQYPDLPSGDEITSLAMVLNYLGYEADKNELCDLYLDKGPVGFTSFYEANVGNPRNAYNSYGCLAPVIVKASNRFTEVNGGKHSAYDLTSYSLDALLYEVASGNPVIVWACEDFDITPSISRIWVVDGQNLYLKSNMATMVLVGYDLINNTVTLSNPAGSVFEIDLSLFEKRFSEIGSFAVVVK